MVSFDEGGKEENEWWDVVWCGICIKPTSKFARKLGKDQESRGREREEKGLVYLVLYLSEAEHLREEEKDGNYKEVEEIEVEGDGFC